MLISSRGLSVLLSKNPRMAQKWGYCFGGCSKENVSNKTIPGSYWWLIAWSGYFILLKLLLPWQMHSLHHMPEWYYMHPHCLYDWCPCPNQFLPAGGAVLVASHSTTTSSNQLVRWLYSDIWFLYPIFNAVFVASSMIIAFMTLLHCYVHVFCSYSCYSHLSSFRDYCIIHWNAQLTHFFACIFL